MRSPLTIVDVATEEQVPAKQQLSSEPAVSHHRLARYKGLLQGLRRTSERA